MLGAALPASGDRVSVVHVFAAEPAIHDELVGLGFEGSVLKHREGRYRPGRRCPTWQKHKTRSRCTAALEVVVPDQASGVVQRIGCLAADDPSRLTWAAAWGPGVRQHLTAGGRALLGREVTLTYTHRTITGALREARVTALA